MEPTVTPESLLADVVASAALEGGTVSPATQAVMLAAARGDISWVEAEDRVAAIVAELRSRPATAAG